MHGKAKRNEKEWQTSSDWYKGYTIIAFRFYRKPYHRAEIRRGGKVVKELVGTYADVYDFIAFCRQYIDEHLQA
jgi:hypothetical protein